MKSALARSSVLGYTLLLALAILIVFWQGRLGEVFRFPGWYPFAMRLVLGVLLAGLVLASARALRGTFRWAQLLELEFQALLSPLTAADACLLAASSGLVEELFFRAALQPLLGLWVTSLAFGVLHYPANRRMIPWTLMAFLLGLMLGYVYLRTGSLLAVAVAHGLINYVELMSIVRFRSPTS